MHAGENNRKLDEMRKRAEIRVGVFVFFTWSFQWIVLPVIFEYNMQHRIFNQCFVAQVIPQALLNVQLMIPILNQMKAQKRPNECL